MANTEFSNYIEGRDAAAALDGTELLVISQGGSARRTTTQNIADLGGGGVTDGDKGDVVVSSSGTVWTVEAASESAAGKAEIATQAETNAGTDDARIVTPLKLTTWFAKYIIDQVSTSTAGATITLNMNSQIQRSHVGSATFATPKTMALSNTTNSLFFNFIFEVTSVSAVLTFPADWLSSSPDFDGTNWTPPNTGKFEYGGSFDDTNNIWYIKVSGPFS